MTATKPLSQTIDDKWPSYRVAEYQRRGYSEERIIELMTSYYSVTWGK